MPIRNDDIIIIEKTNNASFKKISNANGPNDTIVIIS